MLLFCVVVSGQTMKPRREIQGNQIVSRGDPAVQVRMPSEAQYVGGERFVLLGIADCELHLFVEADSERRVSRLYWVQFESYLPTRPELHHTYDSPQHAMMGGMDFYVDTWVRSRETPASPGSDLEHILTLLENGGYRMPKGMMYARFVHLLDDAKRKELMIIFAEDVAPTGYSADELQDGGKASGWWPAITKRLVQKAQDKITVHPNP